MHVCTEARAAACSRERADEVEGCVRACARACRGEGRGPPLVQPGELVVERARRVHELRVERHVLLGRELQLCTHAWHGIARRGMSDDGARMACGGCKEKEKRDCDCN